MKDLTNTEKTTLLANVKSFLSISWTDTTNDNKIWSYIVSCIHRIDSVAGEELDYLVDEESTYEETYQNMCMLGKELMFNRVFYMNEKGLDDFDKNYLSELNSLFLLGKIYKDAQEDPTSI